jgi:hypothetical protein
VAVAIRPQTSLGYQHLGVALSLTGRQEEAVEQLRRAVDLGPTAPAERQEFRALWQEAATVLNRAQTTR